MFFIRHPSSLFLVFTGSFISPGFIDIQLNIVSKPFSFGVDSRWRGNINVNKERTENPRWSSTNSWWGLEPFGNKVSRKFPWFNFSSSRGCYDYFWQFDDFDIKSTILSGHIYIIIQRTARRSTGPLRLTTDESQMRMGRSLGIGLGVDFEVFRWKGLPLSTKNR